MEPIKETLVRPHPGTSRRWYLVTAAVIAVITSAYSAWRCLGGDVPGEEVFRLYRFVMVIVVISWLLADPEIPATQRPSFDHGMFVWMTFPLLAAYHMYAAHRWRGLAIVVGLLSLLFAPDMTIVIAWLVG